MSPRFKLSYNIYADKAPKSNVKEMKRFFDTHNSLTKATSSDPLEPPFKVKALNLNLMEREFK